MRIVILAATAMWVSLNLSGTEAPPKITVSGAGSAKVLPTALEVMITLTEKSEDAKGALLNLKNTRDKIAAKLTPLGVATDQIKAETAAVVDEQNNRNRQQMRGGNRLKRSDKAAEAKPEIQMQQIVRARVPLKGTDVDAITLEGEEIKGKIKAAKLIDEKKDEETENEYSNGNNNNQVSPVSMYFVADIRPETQDAALADAIKKALESATRIAKAMGKGAPELVSISMHSSGQENAGYNQYYYDEWGGRRQYQEAQNSRDSITSFAPNMTYQTTLTAEYRVK
jgi:uncharacterized protein YggE